MTFVICCVVVIISLVSIPILGFLRIQDYPQIGFPITIVLLVFLGTCNAIIQSMVNGLAAVLGPSYLGNSIRGVGFSGLFSSVLRILTKYIGEYGGHIPNIEESTVAVAAFFFTCAFIMLLCLISFVYMINTQFVIQKLKISERDKDGDIEDTSHYSNLMKLWSITKKIWTLEFYLLSILLVTYSVFPGTIFYFKSQQGKDSLMQNWFPVLLGFFYYLGDFIGRSVGKSMPTKEIRIGIGSIMRLIFIPMILVCIKPRLIVDDFLVISLIFGLSFTQGYFLTSAMINAPGKCEGNEKSLASQMMTFFLCFGIMNGSNLGVLLSQIYT
eukprot:gene11131-3950_t